MRMPNLTRYAKYLWLAFPLFGLGELAASVYFSNRFPQVDEWRAVLTALAEEFHAGNASVSPKHYPQTCQYCEQRLLCRLNPSSLDPDVLDDMEEDDSLEENDFA